MNGTSKEKYSFSKYDHKNRWISYWHQIDEVLGLSPQSVLEIGVGGKVVSNYLKDRGVKVVTLDIDDNLKPDVTSALTKMPFDGDAFYVILCAEALEHLPFEKFEEGLKELKRVSKKNIVLSLPHFGHSMKLGFKIPLIKERKLAVRLAFPIKHEFNGEHYWEIGKRGYSPKKIRDIIRKYFKIRKEFIPFENQYHHFFVLEK